MKLHHAVVLAVEPEDVSVERAQERLSGKPLRTRDDVHVEERVTLELANPPIETLVEMLQVVP